MNNDTGTSCIVASGAKLKDNVKYFRLYGRVDGATTAKFYVGLKEWKDESDYNFGVKKLLSQRILVSYQRIGTERKFFVSVIPLQSLLQVDILTNIDIQMSWLLY